MLERPLENVSLEKKLFSNKPFRIEIYENGVALESRKGKTIHYFSGISKMNSS